MTGPLSDQAIADQKRDGQRRGGKTPPNRQVIAEADPTLIPEPR